MRGLPIALSAALVVIALVSLSVGAYHVAPTVALRIIASRLVDLPRDWPDQAETVILSIRLPRIVGAIAVGAGLSFASAVLQAMFRNPLVSPFILGISSGAGFGACVAILLGLGQHWLHLLVFAGGTVAVTLTCLLGSDDGGGIPLVLAGVIVGGFFGSLVSALHYVADPYSRLPEMVFWMMGSLAYVTNESLAWAIPLIAACGGGLYLHRFRLNLLSLGDAEARSLGEDTTVLRLRVVVLTTLLVSATVALSGVIGWVGLVVANVARVAVGPDLRKLLPISALAGAIYLLVIDDCARTLAAVEIPLGVLTSLIGAPAFFLILKGFRRGGTASGRRSA